MPGRNVPVIHLVNVCVNYPYYLIVRREPPNTQPQMELHNRVG